MQSAGPTAATHDAILDAAFDAVCAHGLGKLSLEDVARRAGLSRQTVYRYFGDRDGLITAVILREEQAFIEGITHAADGHPELRPAIEAALATGLRMARAHPLLDRLLASEPQTLLPFLTTGAGPVLDAAQPALEELFAARLPHLSVPSVRRLADAVTRLFVSYAINPPADDVEAVAASLADLIVNGLKETR